MADRHPNKRYGNGPVEVERSFYIGFEDNPLTEEQIRQNQVNKRNLQLQENYNNECQKLINTLDDKIFLSDSLAFIISQVSGGALHISRPGLNYDEENEEIPLLERRGNLRSRLADARLTLPTDTITLNHLSRLLLSQRSKLSNRPEPDTPDIFYRAIRSDSCSRFDKKLGFRSSRQPFTLPSSHGGPLYESSLVDKDILKNHCEGNQPSDLIAMSDSPARILRLIEHWDFNDLKGDMIAVIKVLFNRTTTLAKRLDIKTWAPSRPRGVSWANPNYWVAYRWVPAECIQSYISVASLRSACTKHEIGEFDFHHQVPEASLCGKMEKLSC